MFGAQSPASMFGIGNPFPAMAWPCRLSLISQNLLVSGTVFFAACRPQPDIGRSAKLQKPGLFISPLRPRSTPLLRHGVPFCCDEYCDLHGGHVLHLLDSPAPAA
jgi:hypothetical protein